MITVSIIAIMASMVLFAVFSAQEMAKTQKTKALIAKLDAIIKAKYETYKTRRVPLPDLVDEPFTDANLNGIHDPAEPFVDTNGNGVWDFTIATRSKMRLDALRELMRMELPERWSDVADNPVTPFELATKIPRSSVNLAYQRRMQAGTPTDDFAGAECLYMIVMQAQQEDADDRSAIRPDSIGDVDGDGFPEFVDAWGQPIRFLRWAPGFVSDLQDALKLTATAPTSGTTVTTQSTRMESRPGSYLGGAIILEDSANPGSYRAVTIGKITSYTFASGIGTFIIGTSGFSLSAGDSFFVTAPDPLDPRGVYPTATQPTPSFALYPLIYSAGPDRCFGVVSDNATAVRYSTQGMNPFTLSAGGELIGHTKDIPTEPNFVPRGWVDNIHNHLISAR